MSRWERHCNILDVLNRVNFFCLRTFRVSRLSLARASGRERHLQRSEARHPLEGQRASNARVPGPMSCPRMVTRVQALFAQKKRAQQSVMTQVRATVAVGGEGGNPMLQVPAQASLQAAVTKIELC